MASEGEDFNLMMMDPGMSIPATRVELTVSARKILDLDVVSQSDPVCVLFTKSLGSNEYTEFGRTEVVMNQLNPDFVKKFQTDYFFEENQHLKFELYDVDSKSSDLRKHDFLGRMECTLGEIMGAGGHFTRPLKGPAKNCGKIIIRGEELSECKDMMSLQFRGENLDKKDTFGKSDPFLVFYQTNEDGSFTICHKTEKIKKTLNPKWAPFSVMLRSFCNADYDRALKVECWDWDRDGGHDLIGAFQTTVRELSRGPGHANVYHLIHPKKQKKKKNYKNSGLIFLESAKIEPQHTFLDYIQGGTQLSFTVAIDFTASNGDPRQPSSLHYMNPYQPNHYLRALKAVGTVIQDYDTDKLFPALGFGARVPPSGVVSHEFFLNGSTDNPYCAGVDGVIDAYQRALHTVQLYGPTNFAPVINHVARFASAKRDGSEYFILLIVTDGIITDMEKTKQAIVEASMLPLSIIIVGVGKEDFSKMEVLDGDDIRLSFQGKEAVRDIVQFVPFCDFENSDNIVLSQARLAKEVLAEIPDQLISFMKLAKIHPNPRRPSVASTMSASGTFQPGS